MRVKKFGLKENKFWKLRSKLSFFKVEGPILQLRRTQVGLGNRIKYQIA